MRRYVTVALLLACMIGMAVAVVPTKPRAKTGAPSCVSPIVSISCNLDARSGYVFGINYRTLAEATDAIPLLGNPNPPATNESPKLVSGNFRQPDGPQRLVCASGTYIPTSNPTAARIAKSNVNTNPQQRLVFGLVADGDDGDVQMSDNDGYPAVDRNIDGGTALPSYLISRVQLWRGDAPQGRGKVALIKFQLKNYLSVGGPTTLPFEMECGRPINRGSLDEDNPDEEWDGTDVLGDGQQRYLSGFQGSCYKRNLFNNVNNPQYYLTALNKVCWVTKPATRRVTGTPDGTVWYPAGTPYWDPTPLAQAPADEDQFPNNWLGRPTGITPRLVCGQEPITSLADTPFEDQSFSFATGPNNRNYCPAVAGGSPPL